MAGIPMLLIRGTKSLETENDELSGSIHSVREQLRRIQEKYQKKFSVKNNISEKDKIDLKRLRKEEKILSTKQNLVNNSIQSQERHKQSMWKLITIFLKLVTPFRVLIGSGFLIMSFLVMYAIVVTNIDRFSNSKCGFKCGYILE